MSGDHAAAIALLWDERPAARRGPKPTLTLETIARTGIELADRDGLASVTMQRVAEAVGVTKMALYRYVPGKVELVALMTDLAVGPAPALDRIAGGWRPKLHEWAATIFERFVAHPWSVESSVGDRAVGPNELGWTEQAVAALTGVGLGGGEILDVAVTLVGHVRTLVQQGTAVDQPEESLTTTMASLLRGREDRFPALVAALESAAAGGSRDNALAFGLDRILDGVESLIATRRA